MATSEKLVKREEINVAKEKKWLLKEIQVLEELNEDLQEIFALQKKISFFHKSVEAGKLSDLSKNLRVVQELIENDQHRFKKLRRLLSRGERRRVRYENRVLGCIQLIEASLDKPAQKELVVLVEQIKVYSARSLTELSWQVGKIAELTSQKTPDINLIRRHVDATLEASKALIALLERLNSFMEAITAKIELKKLIQPLLSSTNGLTGYFREGVIKTAVVKSIRPLKYFLEKGLMENISYDVKGSFRLNKIRQRFLGTIDQYKDELRKVLSDDDIEQLKVVSYRVPEEATLLFLPGFFCPILVFNIHSLPDFKSVGWVTTAVPGENLEMISKSGFLTSPLEQVFSKKRYFTDKTGGMTKRFTDGISFSFQEYKKYQSYMQSLKSAKRGPTGGIFVFPIRNILTDARILDWANTMDGWPEIVLRDYAYIGKDVKLVELIASLLSIVSDIYPTWLALYPETKKFFMEAKHKISFLKEISEFINGEKGVMMARTVSVRTIFSPEFKHADPSETFFMAKKRLGAEFNSKLEQAYTLDKNGVEFQKLNSIFISEQQKVEDELYLKQAKFYGEGFFYEKLASLYLRKDLLKELISYLQNNNFFQFSLLVNSNRVGIYWSDQYLIPPIARFAAGEAPVFFDGTIFQQGIDYFWYQKLYGNILHGICLTLTLMKDKPHLFTSGGTHSTQIYVDFMKRMSPHAVKRLFSRAYAEIITALGLLIQRQFRSREPCAIPVKKGILLVNKANPDLDTIQRMAKKGCCIFSQFSSESNDDFVKEEIDFFMKDVIRPTGLAGGPIFFNKQSYFYFKNGKLIIHQRKDNQDFVVEKS